MRAWNGNDGRRGPLRQYILCKFFIVYGDWIWCSSSRVLRLNHLHSFDVAVRCMALDCWIGMLSAGGSRFSHSFFVFVCVLSLCMCVPRSFGQIYLPWIQSPQTFIITNKRCVFYSQFGPPYNTQLQRIQRITGIHNIHIDTRQRNLVLCNLWVN